ncbi:glutamate--tRNA ligase [Patescibacteria group bacterium]|nr:glutamate--tRNA ligase [Patescibacteria group bacterium]
MVRLRFAPSPTGNVHIGTLRTALFNFIIAKKLGGKLILRIEDTDKKREVGGSVDNLLKVMKWIGVEFDEGPHIAGEFGPYTQSQRFDMYKEYYIGLINEEKAYYCFCSPERLDIVRTEQQANKQAPRYDKHCRNLNPEEVQKKLKNNESYVIRQKMPEQCEIKVHDKLRGEICFHADDLEDQVLIKSDTTPTYQFANVVDDHLMQVSLVVRGEEWIPSLPKNILLYKAFGWTPPEFIHLPLILNKNGGKLSKRQGDVAVEDFRSKGYLKDTLINFCALQGWHPREEGKEIYSLNEIIDKFEINDIGISGAIFDTDKLDYLNGYYIRQLDSDNLTNICLPYLKENIQKTTNKKKQTIEYAKKVVVLEQERLKKLSEIGELTEFFFSDTLKYEPTLLIWKKSTKEETKNNLRQLYDTLKLIAEDNWTKDNLKEQIVSYIKEKEGKIGDYLWPMRASLTGKSASPDPFEVAEVLGKEESIKRILDGINLL